MDTRPKTVEDMFRRNIELLKSHGADLNPRKPLAIFDVIKALVLARSATTWLNLPLLALVAFSGLLARWIVAARIKKTRKEPPPLSGLAALTDWVPFPGIRKRQRKLIADEAAEITEFESGGRKRLAKWRRTWAWIYWFWYLISGPFSAAMRLLGKLT